MFKNPFSFNGRIRRLEYALSILIYILVIISFTILIDLISESLSFLILFLYIPLLWFVWAQGAKRCHDRNNSGWYQIIPFYNLWMLFAESDYGENDYGPNPKGEGNNNEIDEIGQTTEQ